MRKAWADEFNGAAVRAYRTALEAGANERDAIRAGMRVAHAKGLVDERLMALSFELAVSGRDHTPRNRA